MVATCELQVSMERGHSSRWLLTMPPCFLADGQANGSGYGLRSKDGVPSRDSDGFLTLPRVPNPWSLPYVPHTFIQNLGSAEVQNSLEPEVRMRDEGIFAIVCPWRGKTDFLADIKPRDRDNQVQSWTGPPHGDSDDLVRVPHLCQ
jgi:hypothetical protein